MYLVVIGYLALILTLSTPLYSWVTAPRYVLLAVTTATVLPAAVAALVSARTLRLLERWPERPSRAQAAFGHGALLSQLVLAGGHAAVVIGTDWLRLCRGIPVVGFWPVVPSLVALVPFLASIVLLWVAAYPADRAVRQIALEVYLVRGRPVRPVWSLVSYLVYNLRHQVLFVLIPMLLILAAADVITLYARPLVAWTGQRYTPDLLVGVAAVVVAVVAPELLRHIWITHRLPNGPLRDRLLRLAAKLRLRCRDILVWRSGGMVVNAAVMGVIAPLRYVLITDAMLEQMDETKIEAVFGHEAGHVKRHHIFYFLVFAFISGCMGTIAAVHLQSMGRPLTGEIALGIGALLAIKWLLIFGWVSRRFERQADLSGVQALTLSGLPCQQPCNLHGNGETRDANPVPIAAGIVGATEALPDRRDRQLDGRQAVGPESSAVAPIGPLPPLCVTAAHIFGDALYEVALLNGIRPEARSWRHSSIASRSRFIQQLAHNPDLLHRFERRVWRIKASILVVGVGAAGWAAYELGIWQSAASLLAR